MGIRDEGCNFDVSGLQVFYVNKIFSKKLDDGNIMVVCGFRDSNRFTPLYVAISPASVALEDGLTYVDAAKSVMKSAH